MAVVYENRPRTVQIVVSVIPQPPFSFNLFIQNLSKKPYLKVLLTLNNSLQFTASLLQHPAAATAAANIVYSPLRSTAASRVLYVTLVSHYRCDGQCPSHRTGQYNYMTGPAHHVAVKGGKMRKGLIQW